MHRALLILSYFRDERKSYIKAKYEEKLYVRGYATDQHEIFADLEAAIGAHSLFDLLQVFGEMSSHGIELTDPLPTSVRKCFSIIQRINTWIIYIRPRHNSPAHPS